MTKPVQLGHLRSPRYRRWEGRRLHPLEEVRMFFDDKGPVPDTFRHLQQVLSGAGIPHIFLGAMALNAHGYRRSTEDVDLCMRREDFARFRGEFVGKRFRTVAGRSRRFFDPDTQVTFDVLISGEIAGNARKQQDVLFPDPSEAETIDGAPCVSLARLIELKLVTWRYQDWADVISLIRVHKLTEAFAEKVHTVARPFYLQCYDQMKEEDVYNAIHEPYDDPNAAGGGAG
jgi:hypothetical protein